MENCLYFVLGYIVASIMIIVSIKVLASFGTIRMIKNPKNDPDNPYILQFGANPTNWLKKKYVVLEVTKK